MLPTVTESDRVRLIQALADLDELSIEYDFGRVFRLGLDDVSAVVRQRSIAALWSSEDPSLIEPFLTMLDDESIDVQAEAARALGSFAYAAETGELPEETGEILFERLMQVALDPRAPIAVARRAVESLGNFGSRNEIEDLILDAFEHDDQTMRAGALFAMGRTQDARWLETLIDELISDDPELRFEAARSLGFIGDSRAVEGLARLATDEDADVRMAAIAAIGEIGSPGSERVLRRLAERATDEDAIAAIIAALEELEDLDAERWDA
jgi:HEAT repeat protein